VPSGWVGHSEKTDPDFPYPKADLTSLPLLDNLTYIRNLQRQQKAYWPEFTWLTDPTADPDAEHNRCYEMFSPDVSRLGYDNTGRVWAIICPQQGVWVDNIVCLNIEVSVFSQRGWVNETTKQFAADMTVGAQVWFSPSDADKGIYDFLSAYAADKGYAFPLSKQNAIQIELLSPEFPPLPYLKVRAGVVPGIDYPEWVMHYNEPDFWSTANVQVKIGAIKQTTDAVVNEFNHLVMNAFNIASGNLLQYGNILTWNLWVGTPERVEQKEWTDHANTWRTSIDSAAKQAPSGPGRAPRFADKTPLVPETEAFKDVCDWLCTKLGMPQTYCPNS
jgi:hypothetical protein